MVLVASSRLRRKGPPSRGRRDGGDRGQAPGSSGEKPRPASRGTRRARRSRTTATAPVRSSLIDVARRSPGPRPTGRPVGVHSPIGKAHRPSIATQNITAVTTAALSAVLHSRDRPRPASQRCPRPRRRTGRRFGLPSCPGGVCASTTATTLELGMRHAALPKDRRAARHPASAPARVGQVVLATGAMDGPQLEVARAALAARSGGEERPPRRPRHHRPARQLESRPR